LRHRAAADSAATGIPTSYRRIAQMPQSGELWKSPIAEGDTETIAAIHSTRRFDQAVVLRGCELMIPEGSTLGARP
jgi:hypothetical protein